ncbi:MAG TPA: hypothetical protein VLH81_03685 [Desulfobacterales bacterium]|nr:hypothetical protein [Desulfobacterales bacterium]
MSEQLPIHPRTGDRAVAVTASGRVIWPIRGGADDETPAGSAAAGEGGEGGAAGTASPDWQAEAAKWRDLSRKHEKRAADANAAMAKLAAQAEEAGKSELEKAASRIAAAETRASAAEVRALRAEIAAEKGLPPALAKRLAGTTREELEADAAELLAAFPPPAEPAASTGRPRETLRSGAVPASEPIELDPRKLAAMIPRR